jgi:hypothetical protein
VTDYVSLAEILGYDPAAMWTLAWTLFFLRLALGFAVGIDDVVQSFRHSANAPDPQKIKDDARSIRRANMVVTALHVAMLAAFALAAAYVPT